MNLRIHALKKASRQRSGVKIAAARFFSILYYPFCAKRSSFFQQNVQPRGNFFAKRPIFVYFADIPPRLTGAKWFVILLIIVPAGSRTRAGSSLPLFPQAIIFCNRRHEGVCLWHGMPGQAPFYFAAEKKEEPL